MATGEQAGFQIGRDIRGEHIQFRRIRKWGLVERHGPLPEEHAHQRGQPAAQAVPRESYVGGGIGRLHLQIVFGGLQELR